MKAALGENARGRIDDLAARVRRWLALRRVDGKARTFIPVARVGDFRRTQRLSHAFAEEAIVFCRAAIYSLSIKL